MPGPYESLGADDISREFKLMHIEAAKQLKDLVEDYADRIEVLTPVDTGHLKGNYTVSKKGDGYVIANNAKYSNSIMILGRRHENGRWQGSEQLPDGILPDVRNWVAAQNNK